MPGSGHVSGRGRGNAYLTGPRYLRLQASATPLPMHGQVHQGVPFSFPHYCIQGFDERRRPISVETIRIPCLPVSVKRAGQKPAPSVTSRTTCLFQARAPYRAYNLPLRDSRYPLALPSNFSSTVSRKSNARWSMEVTTTT